MKILDRYVVRSMLESYIICIVMVLSFYSIIDMFSSYHKFEEYNRLLAETNQATGSIIVLIIEYYWYHIPLIFCLLSPIITLLAAMFTVTRMSRANELVPLKACGIPMFRLFYPFIGFALFISIMMVILQDQVIPNISYKLEKFAHVKHGRKKVISAIQYHDICSRIIYVGKYFPPQRRLENIRVVVPYPSGTMMPKYVVRAKQGEWSTKNSQHALLLKNGDITYYNHDGSVQKPAAPLGPQGITFITDMSDLNLTYSAQKQLDSLSTQRLWQILKKHPNLSKLRVTLHSRFSMPLSNIMLLLLGLPLVLRQQTKNFFLGSGLCAIVAGCFYAVYVLCISQGYQETLNPIFAAWFPFVLFGSLGISFRHLIHT